MMIAPFAGDGPALAICVHLHFNLLGMLRDRAIRGNVRPVLLPVRQDDSRPACAQPLRLGARRQAALRVRFLGVTFLVQLQDLARQIQAAAD